jgi:mono/diheme cytochrome c family protein
MIRSVCLLGALAMSLSFGGTARAEQLPAFEGGALDSFAADATRGETIYDSAGCATCHSVEDDMQLLAGGRVFENRLGKVYAPNITADPVAGIGAWTNDQFLNALLRGVSPEGDSYYGAFFPYAAYARMKPEDALDLFAYLKTLPQSDAVSKEHEVNLFGDSALPPADPQIARGQYLAEALGHCGECHTPRSGFDMDLGNAYSGYMGFFGDYAPDITKARLEKFGPEAFINGTMASGLKLNGKPLAAGSMRRVTMLTGKLPVEDRAALYAYLTNTPVDVATLSKGPVKLADAGKTADATVVEVQATTDTADPITETVKATPVAVIDPVELGKPTGSVDLMKAVAAGCEPPAVAPDLTAAPVVEAPVVEAAPVGVSAEIESAADRVLDKSCRTCHGPGQRNDRTFPMHDIGDIALDPGAVTPGDPDKSPLYTSIALNRMPLGTKLTPEELDAIKAWIVALGEQPATPAPVAEPEPVATIAVEPATPPVTAEMDMPTFVGGDFTQMTMAAVADLRAIDERDRIYIRYFSFADTPLPPVDCAMQGMMLNPMHYLHAGLNKFVNSVSRGPRLAAVVPVDGTDGALVRVDMRDYGWSAEDWDAISTGAFTQGAVEAGFTQEAWTDLAQVYPYAIDPASDSLLAVLADGTGTPVPIVGASWFTHHVSEAPYYDMLLRLPADIKDLEYRMGVDVNKNIYDRNVVRAGFAEGSSGVSDHNRMIERHDLPRGGYYWKSYDFANSDDVQSLLLHPDGPVEAQPLPSGTQPFEHDGGEMIFSLDNGLQGYYLSTNLGKRLQVGPASIVSYRNKPVGKGVEIVNARSCFDCHENGIIRKSDELRAFIESSNVLSRDQRDVLLEIYAEPDKLEDAYRKDSEAFLASLEDLGITQSSAAGIAVSLQAPMAAGGGEIVTYLSDLQFDNLDLEAVARTFFLTEQEFRDRLRTVGDATLMQVVDGWIQRIDAGQFVTRSEIEDTFADLLPRLTDYRPYQPYVQAYQPQAGGAYDEKAVAAVQYQATQQATDYLPPAESTLPAYAPAADIADPLILELSVPYVEVHVNDLLEFDVRANRACELQVLYVEETKSVEELPPEVIGPTYLEPGETRRIPYPGSGYQLRFDTTGQGETMVAYCREGGLGDTRITGEQAVKYAADRFQPLSRGLVIERTEQVARDNGASATNAVTFNVAQ